eukprot:Gregarina_sp_Poly_1__1701@NODE_1438_length_4150_cov_6_051678_g954_i0_p1_GENE_NODE_1438_length_4150_cov_6_051678_g954_i0NODE_1438_length_4150_cov_6_051678_g954_i0_p1_ORF_typecomplete_len981_score114_45HAP2GCS1/PF10699_9/3e15_NODE_1438_length_4150_cov_6_051678_g954_i0942943
MARKSPSDQGLHPSIGKLSRDFYLNWTSPEAYDEEFDFGFRILFSAPRSGSQPPDLSTRYNILIPNNPAYLPHPAYELRDADASPQNSDSPPGTGDHVPAEGELTQRLPALAKWLEDTKARSLLVPSNLLDLSGKACDKIGVSLFTWAAETGPKEERGAKPHWIASDNFCAQTAGSCTRNQPNDLFDADIGRLASHEKPLYLLTGATLPDWSSEAPLLLSEIPRLLESDQNDETAIPQLQTTEWSPLLPRHVAWPTNVGHSTSLEVILNATEIAWMAGSPQGAIDDLLLHTIDPAKEVQVIGVVRNKDVFAGRFSLGSSPCAPEMNGDKLSDIEQVPLSVAPVSKTIESNHAELFVLTLTRPVGNEQQTFQCDIRLFDAKGALVDTRNISVAFTERPEILINHEQPFFSEAKLNRVEVPISDTSFSLSGSSWILGGGAGHSPHATVTEFSWDASTCPCALANLWCITSNFAGCTRKVRNAIVTFVCLLLGAGVALACGPSLITFSVKAFIWSVCFVRRRLKRFQIALQKMPSPVKLDVDAIRDMEMNRDGCKAQANSSASTTSRTPLHKEEVAIASENTAINPRDQNTVPPNRYLPPFFWGMPVPLAAAIFRSKIGNNLPEGHGWTHGFDWQAAEAFLANQEMMLAEFGSTPTDAALEGHMSSEPYRPNSRSSHHATPRHRQNTNSANRPSSSKSVRGREVLRAPGTGFVTGAISERFENSDEDDIDQVGATSRGFPRYLCWSPPRKRAKDKPRLNYYPPPFQGSPETFASSIRRAPRSVAGSTSRPLSKRTGRRPPYSSDYTQRGPIRIESYVRNFKRLTSYNSADNADSSAEERLRHKQHNRRYDIELKGRRGLKDCTNQYMALSSNVRLTNVSKRVVQHKSSRTDDMTSRARFGPSMSVITSNGTENELSPFPHDALPRRFEHIADSHNLRSHTDPGSSTEDSTCK